MILTTVKELLFRVENKLYVSNKTSRMIFKARFSCYNVYDVAVNGYTIATECYEIHKTARRNAKSARP